MSEATPMSKATGVHQRADLLGAAFLAKNRGRAVVGFTDLLLGITQALDDLAGPLAALVEGIDAGEAPDSEVFRARLALARAALWRHQGQPPGRVG